MEQMKVYKQPVRHAETTASDVWSSRFRMMCSRLVRVWTASKQGVVSVAQEHIGAMALPAMLDPGQLVRVANFLGLGPPPKPAAQGVPPVRVGVLGASQVCTYAAIWPSRRVPGCEVVAVAARDGKRAASFARQYNIPRSYSSYDALLQDPDIDAVYVGLPNGLHGAWARRALLAGKHVLCEKPFAANEAEAREVQALARKRGLLCREAFHYREHPLMARLQQLLAPPPSPLPPSPSPSGARGRGEGGDGACPPGEGLLGTVERIDARLLIPRWVFGSGNIRFMEDLAGGAMMDAGCYCAHISRTLAGAAMVAPDRPQGPTARVSARGAGQGGAVELYVASAAARLREGSKTVDGAMIVNWSTCKSARHRGTGTAEIIDAMRANCDDLYGDYLPGVSSGDRGGPTLKSGSGSDGAGRGPSASGGGSQGSPPEASSSPSSANRGSEKTSSARPDAGVGVSGSPGTATSGGQNSRGSIVSKGSNSSSSSSSGRSSISSSRTLDSAGASGQHRQSWLRLSLWPWGGRPSPSTAGPGQAGAAGPPVPVSPPGAINGRFHASLQYDGLLPISEVTVTGSRGTLLCKGFVVPFFGHVIHTTVQAPAGPSSPLGLSLPVTWFGSGSQAVKRTERAYGSGETTYYYQLERFVDDLQTWKADRSSPRVKEAMQRDAEDCISNMRFIDAAYTAAGLGPRQPSPLPSTD